VRAEVEPYYCAGTFYIPFQHPYLDPFITLKAGHLSNAKLNYLSTNERGEPVSQEFSGKSSSIIFNYLVFETGIDYRITKFLVLSPTVGYQLAHLDELHGKNNDIVYLKNKKEFTLDFSGSFISLGIRYVF